jgi:hypothetical protein
MSEAADSVKTSSKESVGAVRVPVDDRETVPARQAGGSNSIASRTVLAQFAFVRFMVASSLPRAGVACPLARRLVKSIPGKRDLKADYSGNRAATPVTRSDKF